MIVNRLRSNGRPVSAMGEYMDIVKTISQELNIKPWQTEAAEE